MRLVSLLLLAAAALLAGSAPADAAGRVRAPLNDASTYEVELTGDARGIAWTGTERITVRNAGRTTMRQVWLRLWGNGPTGCGAPAVTAEVVGGGARGRSLRDCTALEVRLDEPLRPGGETTIALDVAIIAPAVKDRFGRSGPIALFGNALPTVAQRDRGGWRLPGYSRYGESFVSSWARWRLTLHHPQAVSVAASGTTLTQPGDDGAVTTTSSVVARDAFWAAGPMVEQTATTSRGVRIRAWAAADEGSRLPDAIADARSALDGIERRLPDYPYPELDVVVAEIEAGGGMEYPTAVITDGSSEVTRHEVAHQWFFGLVGGDQYREPWIDEGLTSFLEYSWTTPRPLPLPTCIRSSRLRVRDPDSFVTASMAYWNRHPGQYWLAYGNPVCALRELERQIGPRDFRRTMAGLVERRSRRILTGAELRSAFRRVGGSRADQTFRRWGLGPGR